MRKQYFLLRDRLFPQSGIAVDGGEPGWMGELTEFQYAAHKLPSLIKLQS